MVRRRMRERFCLVRVRLPDAARAEWAAAEAWQAGAAGVEERDETEGSTLLLVYAPAAAADAVHAALASVPGARPDPPEPVDDTDWSEQWRRGLAPVRVGQRLVVRPSWLDPGAPAPEADIVIDPGQAFGTGGHVSTRLALEWIEELSRPGAGCGLAAGSRVLDVGTGSGVLALAALALAAGRAVAFDIDPESGIAARHWAAENGLADRMAVFVGPIEALGEVSFDCVLANLLKRELLPLADEIARVTRPGGRVVLSGLLAPERDEVERALTRAGFVPTGVRRAVDPNGDEWVSLVMTRS